MENTQRYDIERLKETELDILDYIAGVCEENHIKYYLYYGSLIGAIRHKDFIPWDDDVDIACSRDDYEKLVAILEKNMETNDRFFIQNLRTDPCSPVLHTKVRMNKTSCVEKNAVSEEQHTGIFVDIFPMDRYEDRFSFNLRIKLILAVYSARCHALFPLKYKGWKSFLLFPISHFPARTYNRWIEKLVPKYNPNCKMLAGYINGRNVKGTWIEKTWQDQTILWPFRGRSYRIPTEYDRIMRKSYGDSYMELPPMEKRFSHEFQSVIWENDSD